MTEPTREYGKNYDNLRFIRLRGSYPEDLVGLVTYKEECILVEHPLRIESETFFEEGRQIMSVQEYLPQSIVEIKEIEIQNEDILFVTPVKKDFIEQYEYFCGFFYEEEKKVKESPTKKMSENMEKVVSILDAMQAKKDKPVH